MPLHDIYTAHKPCTSWRGSVILALALLAGALLPGCGSSNGHRASGSSGPRKPIMHETYEEIVAGVEACREGVALATWLTASNRAELDETCDKGLKRGLTEVRQYGEQVCSEVAFTTPSLRTKERPRILAACEAKTERFEPSMHGSVHY
jgi:hypothetical protein